MSLPPARPSGSWNRFASTSASRRGSIRERDVRQVERARDRRAQFTALVIERRAKFLGKRIDIASDELTSATVAALISEASGRRIEYTALSIDAVRQQNEDLARMYEWFDRVGYDADIVGLRSLYPEVDWHRFSTWAREQDWSAITVRATTQHTG